jgi:hypothetical protein
MDPTGTIRRKRQSGSLAFSPPKGPVAWILADACRRDGAEIGRRRGRKVISSDKNNERERSDEHPDGDLFWSSPGPGHQGEVMVVGYDRA